MKWRYAFRKVFAFDGGVCLKEGRKRGMLVAVVYASEAGRESVEAIGPPLGRRSVF